MPRKACIVVTARPSYARIKTVIQAVKDHPDLELQLVVAASALLERYGAAVDVMRQDGFEPDALVYMVLEGENTVTMAKSTGLGLVELATVFDNLQPDLVVTVADRYETLATATAASYMNLPTVHVQGGEVSGSIDEKVRHAVTKLSDLHLVSTERAREYVIRMGERPETVHRTGCPSIDIADRVATSPVLGADPFDRYGGTGPSLDLSDGFLVVLQHPVTTEEDEAFQQISETLHAVHDTGVPILWFWPNVDAGSDGTSKGIRVFRELYHSAPMHFFRNMPPEEFLRLLVTSKGIVGNSSVAIRECSYLGVPAVNIGTRQAGRERGRNLMDVPHERAAILEACRAQLDHGGYESDRMYGDGHAGQRIADLISVAELTSSKRLDYL
ncbi:MAG: UDP-N-acetylglucosamine 2-epimerase [Solirubrobacteraceae bacterium]